VLTEEAKNLIAPRFQHRPKNRHAKFIHITTPANPSRNPALAESGCTKSKSVYQQNGQTWLCWDAKNRYNPAPSDDIQSGIDRRFLPISGPDRADSDPWRR
jgi:hypothetical protein